MRTRRKPCQQLVAALLVVAGVAVLPIKASQWTIETIDSSGAGYYTSLKADSTGNLHAAYVPQTPTRPLKYAFWDNAVKRWFTMEVANKAEFCTLVLDSKGHPRVSYVDWGSGPGAKLRYAIWDGSWKVQAIDVRPGGGMAYYTSLALDRNDNPIFTYFVYLSPAAEYVYHLESVAWEGTYWGVRTVDRTYGSGKFNSVAVDSTGRPQVAYANAIYETDSLRYATWNGKSWNQEIIEAGDPPFPVYSVSMVLDKKDVPHIVYTDLGHRLIKYATRQNGKWQTEAVDSYVAAAENVGYWDRDGIVADSEGNPYVSYFDKGAGVLKVAHRANGRWYREIVDRNMSGLTSSLAIADGRIWVSYAGLYEQSFKVASRPLDETTQSALSESRAASSAPKK